MVRRSAVVAVLLLVAGCNDGGGDLDAFCATARRFEADNPADAFTRIDTDDPAATATALRDAADRLAEWAGQAPSEIDDDVDALVDSATALADQFEALATEGGDEPDLDAIDPAAATEASQRVVEFTRTECDVELEPGP